MPFSDLWKTQLKDLRFLPGDLGSEPRTGVQILAGHALTADLQLDTHWRHIRQLEAAVLLMTDQTYHVDKKLPEILTALVDWLNAQDRDGLSKLDSTLCTHLHDLQVALGR